MSAKPDTSTGDIKTAVNHAMVLLSKGQSQLAREQAEEILQHYPDEINSLLVVAVAIRDQGDNAEALKRLQTLVKRVPDFALAKQELGFTYAETGQILPAIEALQGAVAIESKLPASWKLMAELFLDDEDENSADPWIVKARRNAVGLHDLPVLILEQVGHASVQDPCLTGDQRGRMFTGLYSQASGLHADKLDRLVADEGVEEAYCVAAATHTGDGVVRKLPGEFEQLPSGLGSNDRLEVSHEHRIWVRSHDATYQVVRRLHVRYPVPDSLIYRVLERATSRFHRPNLGAKQPHSEDV